MQVQDDTHDDSFSSSSSSDMEQIDELNGVSTANVNVSIVEHENENDLEHSEPYDSFASETFNDNTEFNDIDIDCFRTIHKSLKCSVRDAMNMIYAYSIRHNLSWIGVENLVRLVNAIVDTNVLIPSKYVFKKMFEGRDKTKPVVHFWCHNCNKYLGTEEDLENICEKCNTEVCKDMKYRKNHFISIPIENHLKEILQRNSKHIEINKNSIDGVICDVHDGENFRRMKTEMANVPFVTLSMYTDGAAVFKATKDKSFWPINIFVNEIDLNFRFKRSNILCSAISFGKTPNMQTFLKPLIDDIKTINNKGGIVFRNKHGEIGAVKIVPMIFTADALAKAYVLNIVQHNGHYGCPYCLHAGTIIEGSTQIRYCNRDNAICRTNIQSRSDMMEAHTDNTNVNGYNGLSPLMALGPDFDVVWQVVIDKMHCVDMGVIKKMFNLFLCSKNREEEYAYFFFLISLLKLSKIFFRYQIFYWKSN